MPFGQGHRADFGDSRRDIAFAQPIARRNQLNPEARRHLADTLLGISAKHWNPEWARTRPQTRTVSEHTGVHQCGAVLGPNHPRQPTIARWNLTRRCVLAAVLAPTDCVRHLSKPYERISGVGRPGERHVHRGGDRACQLRIRAGVRCGFDAPDVRRRIRASRADMMTLDRTTSTSSAAPLDCGDTATRRSRQNHRWTSRGCS
jgi:hypothetical protein